MLATTNSAIMEGADVRSVGSPLRLPCVRVVAKKRSKNVRACTDAGLSDVNVCAGAPSLVAAELALITHRAAAFPEPLPRGTCHGGTQFQQERPVKNLSRANPRVAETFD